MNSKSNNTDAAVDAQGGQNAPEATKATKKASPKKGAPKAKKSAKEPKAAKKAKAASRKATSAGIPREFSKKAIILDLLRRKEGATVAEIAKAAQWQNHSIRGFLSGHVSKKMGLTIESTRNEKGERTYRILGK